MKQLIIAEKREQAEKYNLALGNGQRKGNTFLTQPDLHIAFCAGHLADIKNSGLEGYKQLPYFPGKIEYGFNKRNNVKALVDNLKEEIAWADELIIGTDADREGESIFYTLLGFFPKEKRKIKWRLWANSLTKDGIQKAFNHLRPAKETYSNYLAADARRTADWLFGVANATPLIRKDLEQAGNLARGEHLSVGRIKCPMMKMVIDNNEAIKHYVSKAFWKIEATDEQGTLFTQKETYGGEDNDLTQAEAQETMEASGTEATVTKVENEEKVIASPPLFNLTNLQDYLSRKYHLSADETLKLVAKLRTDGFLSYPRTDCTHITEYEFAYLKAQLAAYQALLSFSFECTYPSPRKRYVDDKKVVEHYAIIPTEDLPDLEKLSEQERLVYEIVTKRTILMFASDKKVAKTKVTINNGLEFSVTGQTVLEKGWAAHKLEVEKTSEKPEKTLPPYSEGQTLQVATKLKEGITQPPQRLTESGLLKLLKKWNIGTSATRATAISRMVKDGFVSFEKKTGQFTPETKAYLTINALAARHSTFISPQKTGEWEEALQKIADGKAQPEHFIDSVKEELVKTIKGEETCD